eukprot:c29404_g1_i1 orf=510-3407(-)
MRRVFPLRQAENCGYGEADELQRKLPEKLEESNNKDSSKKPDEQNYASVKTADSTDKSMKKLLTNSCDSSIASGDENLPAANIINNKEAAVAWPSSNQKPPRASAYPVFTAGASHQYTSPHAGVPLDKVRQKLCSERQRSTSFSSHISVDSQSKLVKETTSNISKNQNERPLSAPKNRAYPDAFSRQNSFRTHSLRLTQLPDTVTLPDGGDEGPCYAVSDRRLVAPPFHTRSFSQATSEMSLSESSDFSSCFTKATESSSSRTLASESPSSKRSPVAGRPGRGNSPFKYLSARMVAEKLVKVLGKEKIRPQLSRPKLSNSSQCLQDNTADISCEVDQQQAVSSEAKVWDTYSKGSSMPSGCHVKQNSSGAIGIGHEHWVLQKDIHSRVQNANNARLTKGNSLDAVLNSGHPHSLEARALALEELAICLDKENTFWERKCKSGNLADYPVEVSVHDFNDLKNEIRKLCREKKDLALEVAGEIRTRIAEQDAAADQLKRLKSEMEAKVSAVEKDKQSLRESLERELERRGEEWNAKQEKMKVEERKMRERVKELAEDKVELQKVVASFKERENSWRAEAKNFECFISTLKQRMKTSEAEMGRQIQASADTIKQLKASDGELETLTQRNANLEMESSEMQKEVTRLRRVCNDQEMTIEGLWQELDEAVNGTFDCRSESMLRLQRELLRLAGVEQGLRNEVNAMHVELTGLKQDKCVAHIGTPADLVRLNQELQDNVAKLQSRVDVLQAENKNLSLSLRAAVRARRDAERNLKMSQFEERNRTRENLRALERVVERGDALITSKDTDESGRSFRHSLKEENFRVLNSKLQSREAELEQLDEEIIEVINTRDSLQMEVDDLHGRLIVANQRIRELERQVDNKEEVIEVLQADAEKYKKELSNLQNELPRIRRQRDEVHKEAEDMSREALRLTLELNEAKKVAEKLEEEVMLKEGQISILRGTYTNCDYFS